MISTSEISKRYPAVYPRSMAKVLCGLPKKNHTAQVG